MDNQHQRYMESHPNVKIERTVDPLRRPEAEAAAGRDRRRAARHRRHRQPGPPGLRRSRRPDRPDRAGHRLGSGRAYFKGPWDSTVYQGKNYGIPDNSNCLVLWYNTDYHRPPEFAPPTTWDELTAAVADADRGRPLSAWRSAGSRARKAPSSGCRSSGRPARTSRRSTARAASAALQLWVDYVANGYMSQGILGWSAGRCARPSSRTARPR